MSSTTTRARSRHASARRPTSPRAAQRLERARAEAEARGDLELILRARSKMVMSPSRAPCMRTNVARMRFSCSGSPRDRCERRRQLVQVVRSEISRREIER